MSERNKPLKRKELALITPVFRPFLRQGHGAHGCSKPLRSCRRSFKKAHVQPSWVPVAKKMPSGRLREVFLHLMPSFAVSSRLRLLLWPVSTSLPLVQQCPLKPPALRTQPPIARHAALSQLARKATQGSCLPHFSLQTCPSPLQPDTSLIPIQCPVPGQVALLPQGDALWAPCRSSYPRCPLGPRAQSPGKMSHRPQHRNRPQTALCLKTFYFMFFTFFPLSPSTASDGMEAELCASDFPIKDHSFNDDIHLKS